MKTALVCIAKNEDNYIDEWIHYHTKLGFDMIFVYQNDWTYNKDKTCFKNVKWIEFNGVRQQLNAYNNFINACFDIFDWVAFFDVDEFLCIPNSSLKEYLLKMNKYYGIGINWRLFGDNGLSFNNDYNILNRFIKCGKHCNQHVKMILHLSMLKKYKQYIKFQDPHSISISNNNNLIVSSDGKRFIHGPFNKNYDDSICLNHYFCKTIEEYKNKIARGRACSPTSLSLDNYNGHNVNEVENTIARDFFNKK